MKFTAEEDEASSSEDELSMSDKAILGMGHKIEKKISKEAKENKRQSSNGNKRKKESKEDKDKFDFIIVDKEEFLEKKQRKSNRQSSDSRRAQEVLKDENGVPILPLKLGPLTLVRLGTIVYDREKFHNRRYIWPLGFESIRTYFSMKNPDKHIIYTSRILDGGDGPIFQVVPEDDPENPVTAITASPAWTSIVRKVNEAKNKGHMSSASGPEYFGFGNPTIARLIQEMPNAVKCKNYIMQPYQIVTDRQTSGLDRLSFDETSISRGKVDEDVSLDPSKTLMQIESTHNEEIITPAQVTSHSKNEEGLSNENLAPEPELQVPL